MNKWVSMRHLPPAPHSPLHTHTTDGIPLSNCSLRWFCLDFARAPELDVAQSPLFAAGNYNFHPCTCAVPSLGHSLILTSAWFRSSKLRVQKHSHYFVPSGGTRVLQGSWPLLYYLFNSHCSLPAYILEEWKVKTLFSHTCCSSVCPYLRQFYLQAFHDYIFKAQKLSSHSDYQKCLLFCNSPQNLLLGSVAWTLFLTHSVEKDD